MEVIRNFDQDAKDNAEFANVNGVIISGSAHWLIDEAPGQVIPKLVQFFNR